MKKSKYTKEMIEDLIDKDGVDVNKLLEDILSEEIMKSEINKKIEERDIKINDLLDESE